MWLLTLQQCQRLVRRKTRSLSPLSHLRSLASTKSWRVYEILTEKVARSGQLLDIFDADKGCDTPTAQCEFEQRSLEDMSAYMFATHKSNATDTSVLGPFASLG
jgi:hypothetical protein